MLNKRQQLEATTCGKGSHHHEKPADQDRWVSRSPTCSCWFPNRGSNQPKLGAQLGSSRKNKCWLGGLVKSSISSKGQSGETSSSRSRRPSSPSCGPNGSVCFQGFGQPPPHLARRCLLFRIPFKTAQQEVSGPTHWRWKESTIEPALASPELRRCSLSQTSALPSSDGYWPPRETSNPGPVLDRLE